MTYETLRPEDATLSAEQIERQLERQMDVLDRAYLRGDISEQFYDEEVRLLCQRASGLYHILRLLQTAKN